MNINVDKAFAFLLIMIFPYAIFIIIEGTYFIWGLILLILDILGLVLFRANERLKSGMFNEIHESEEREFN